VHGTACDCRRFIGEWIQDFLVGEKVLTSSDWFAMARKSRRGCGRGKAIKLVVEEERSEDLSDNFEELDMMEEDVNEEEEMAFCIRSVIQGQPEASSSRSQERNNIARELPVAKKCEE
jgi:hypothetical protein